MAEQQNNNTQNSRQQQAQRNIQNNANNIKNAADVAIASKNPYAMAAGAAVKAADKISGGKSTQALGKAMNTANRFSPGGRRLQKASNKLSESGASDKIGQAAAMKNQMSGSGGSKAASSNKSTGGKNNSGFGSSKSGLFSTKNSSSSADGGGTTSSWGEGFKNSKKIIGIIVAIASILFLMLICAVIAFVVIGQIMSFFENIGVLAEKYMEGREKLINFVTGDGWMSNEDAFFNTLNKEYESFPYTGGDKFDIALIASTIHYSVTVDLNEFENPSDSEEVEDPESTTTQVPMTGALDKKQTRAFYEVALDKLGSANTKVLGQKRLLGYAVKTDISLEFYTWAARKDSAQEWHEFLMYLKNTVGDTFSDLVWDTPLGAADPFTAIGFFNRIYDKMNSYLIQNSSAFASWDYDGRNRYYEIQELVYRYANLFEDTKEIKEEDYDVGSEEDPEGKSGGWIPTPEISRTMNYGYDEYKQMQKDVVEIKTILSNNGINVENDEDAIEQAKDSSDTELKKLYANYEKNEKAYMYSYTHYLQKVYIPFTYFYKKEYTTQQVDTIVDEIFNQRDFYYYLMGEDTTNYNCGGSCTYSVDGKEISNLKVKLLQCSDEELGNPIVGEELVDFEKYILGVVYAEIGPDAPVEAAKAQAIAARSYALLRPKNMGNAAGLNLEKENGNWVLSIRNCVEDQVYCDPDKGCSSSVNPNGYNSVTMYSGSNTKSYQYKGPLAEDSQIRSAVSAVSGKVLLDSKGNIVSTGYTSVNQNQWKKQANEGMDYTEILLSDYENGSSISESSCSKVCNQATGDFTQWKQLASLGAPWADVVIGNGKTINQIGCLATSVSIQIARSGVPLQNINGEFNPGTFVEAIKPNGFVTSNGSPGGTLFVWNSSTIVAPTFQYSHGISLSGLTQTQKAHRVQDLINQGCYVVMEVKGNGGGEHYVAVDYVQGNNVYMMDPASTEVVTWNQYPYHWTSAAYCYKVTS